MWLFFSCIKYVKTFRSEILEKDSVYYEIIGKTQKDSLNLDKEFDIKLSELNELNTFWFKDYFEES